jgi:hypothetical protein
VKRNHHSFTSAEFERAALWAGGFTQACLCLFDEAGAADPVRRTALKNLLPFSVAWLAAEAAGAAAVPKRVTFKKASVGLMVACKPPSVDPAMAFLRSAAQSFWVTSRGSRWLFSGRSLRRYAPPADLIGTGL